MAFNYEKDTKQHYQSDRVAEVYYNYYALNKGWGAFRFRTVAYRERVCIQSFMQRVPHAKILDIPTGTGKLARIFKEAQSEVKACDISLQMLELAKKEFDAIEHYRADFQVCDAENIVETLNDHFDLAVCLRLLHRVPNTTKENILDQLAEAANYAIVSVGVESHFHKCRRFVRNILFRGGTDGLCYEAIDEIHEMIGKYFHIMDSKWLIPGISQEMIFLLQSRNK